MTKAVHSSRGGSLSAPFDPDEAATLVKKVGGTTAEAKALSTKVIGESGGDPKAIGNDPGGTTGLGLWQLTTGVGNDDLINRHGGQRAMLKPKPNARAALELYRSGGIGNWYAPSNAPGTPQAVKSAVKPKKRDVGILRKAGVPVPKKSTKAAPKAPPRKGKVPSVVRIGHKAEKKFGLHVGENPAFGGVEPVHTSGSYHYRTDAKGRGEAIDVSGDPSTMMAFDKWVAKKWGPGISELFYDPGVSIKDGSRTSSIGGHSDHVHVAVGKPGEHFSGSVGGGLAVTGVSSSSSSGGSVGGTGLAFTSPAGVSSFSKITGIGPMKAQQMTPKQRLAAVRKKIAAHPETEISSTVDTTPVKRKSSSTSPSATIPQALRRKYGKPAV